MWFRGCVHVHTSEGDGLLDPLGVANWYKDNGYDFIAITDHNKFTEVKEEKLKNFLIIRNSIEFGQWDTLLHILGLGLSKNVISNLKLTHQDKIDFIIKNNGIPILCHPNWRWTECSFEMLLKLKNYEGIEIFNACMLEEVGSMYALEKWDYILEGNLHVLFN